MNEVIRWVASDTAIRPRIDLTRGGDVVDLASVSAAAIILRSVVPSGVTAITASYAATIAASTVAAEGAIETLTYGAAPLATKGQYRMQARLTSPAGVETLESSFTVVIRERF